MSQFDEFRKEAEQKYCALREHYESLISSLTSDYEKKLSDKNEEVRRLNKLSEAVKQSGSSIVITDVRGKIEYVNPFFEEITGYKFDEVIGRNPRILKSGNQDEAFYKNMWETLSEGKIWKSEFHNRKKDGTYYWEYSTIAPLIDDSGNITNYIAVKEDITLRKETEIANEKLLKELELSRNSLIESLEKQNTLLDELAESEEQLLKANAELEYSQNTLRDSMEFQNLLINDLAESKETLKNLNAEKDKFFSIIAHDLKGSLGSFMQATEMLESEYDAFDRDSIYQMIQSMKNSSHNLYKLLENLLDWARLQRGAIVFNLQEVKLKDVFEENINMVSSRAEQKGILLEFYCDDTIVCKIDRNMINTVIRNLLSNALKFTKRDGIVKLMAEKKESEVIVSISDNGIGMPSSIKEKLFKIDENVGSLGTDNEPSTGLGLILCNEFIQKHGSSIQVESEERKGSKFSFSLRLA